MDTRSTVPLDSQGSPAPPDLVLADMLELSKDRLGAAIFLDALQLSPGATAFKEWLLSDFIEGPEHILDVSDAERFETLARVYEITKQLVTEAQAKAQSNVQFVTVGHDRVMRSAEQAVAKVTKQAAGKHDEASKQRVRVAEAWLQKEMASLENKKQEHASAATRCATFAAAKIHCFINHLREANLLSSSFVALMETWHELDACHTTASKLKQVDKQLWDTQVEADTLKDNEDMDAFGFADEEADPAPEQTPGSPEPLASQIFVDGDGAQEELILAVHPAADGHQHGHGADLEHQQCPGQQQSADQGADLGHQQSAPETLGHPATAQGADLGHQQSAPEMAGHPNGEGADLGHPQLAPEEADLGHTQSAPEAGHPNGQGADLGHPQSAFQEADLGHPQSVTEAAGHPNGQGADLGHQQSAFQEADLGHTQSVTEATGHPDGQGADLGHRQSAPEEADLGHPQSAPEAAGHPDGQQADLGHQQSACEEADLGRPQSAPEAAGHPDGQQADLGQQQSAPEARHQQSVSQEADLGHQQQQLAPEIGESQQCEQAVNDMVAEQAHIIDIDEIADDELVTQLEAMLKIELPDHADVAKQTVVAPPKMESLASPQKARREIEWTGVEEELLKRPSLPKTQAPQQQLQVTRAEEGDEEDEESKAADRASDDLPPAIREKAQLAQKTRKYGELLDLFIELGEDWSSCSLQQNSVTADRRLVTGGQKYKRYKDIVAEEGEQHAIALRDRKKDLQSSNGDLHPGVPHWYSHPDWPTSPDMELFLCWDESKVASSNDTSTTTQQNISMELDGSLAKDLRLAAPTLVVDPTGAGRKLRPAHSHESLDDVNPKGKGKGRTKDNKPKENPNGKKPTKPNFAAKAHVKVKNGRTTLTESKYWLRKMDEEKAQEDITKRKVSKQLADGYTSQIELYQGPVQAATDALDMKLIEGAKDEASLQPLMAHLDKAMEEFATAMRPIRSILMLALVVVPYAIGYDISYTLAQRVAHAAVEIAASFNYCVLGLAPLHVDPNDITPEAVEQTNPEDLLAGDAVVQFPKGYFCEVRADWKFMKDHWPVPPGTLAKEKLNVRLARAHEEFMARVVTGWLADLVIRLYAEREDCKHVAFKEMVKYWLNQFFQRMEEYGRFLGPAEKDCMGMAYANLASMAAQQSQRLWPLRPKLHAPCSNMLKTP
ncbi:F5 [Symbiodinium microadriaticum]|nr:F5 [Symbiodinium microadriaticum]